MGKGAVGKLEELALIDERQRHASVSVLLVGSTISVWLLISNARFEFLGGVAIPLALERGSERFREIKKVFFLDMGSKRFPSERHYQP